MTDAALTLIVRRHIPASRDRVFDAWTDPALVQLWWGPAEVRCPHAEFDLKVGGKYRIANEFEDGRVLWIEGEFVVVDPPARLVYTWRTDPDADPELVTVRFEASGADTEVIVLHERMAEAARAGHEKGWFGCLDGLEQWAVSGSSD